MHLFFDTVWKLHIGEIPEKPKERDYIDMSMDLPDNSYYNDLQTYNEAIAAIKQNALPVGNPEIFLRDEWGYGKFIHMPDGSNHLIESDHFYFWPGGYKTKEKELWTSEREPASCFTTVAILTLPEEKKNTMKNLTKEQAIEAMKEGKKVTHTFFMNNEWIKMEGNRIISEDDISVPVSWFWVERSTQGWSNGWGLYKDHPTTASDSAENITKEQQFNLPHAAVFNLQQIALADDEMVKAPGAAEKYRFIARHILELFVASGSVAAPKEEASAESILLKKVGKLALSGLKWKSLADRKERILEAMEEYKNIELASLRQQLEQKTLALDSYYKLAAEVAPLKEALKELLDIIDFRSEMILTRKDHAIIDRARKTLNQ